MLKNWAGEAGAINRLIVQHRGMDVVGNTLTASGRVTKVSRLDVGKQVDCELWIDNQLGQRTETGMASLVVSRE
jgi:hypothetical protein